MNIFCAKHDTNHKITVKETEVLIYYYRRSYIDSAFAAPLIATPISNGPEFAYNRTCPMEDVKAIKGAENTDDDININVAYALSDYKTRVHKDKIPDAIRKVPIKTEVSSLRKR